MLHSWKKAECETLLMLAVKEGEWLQDFRNKQKCGLENMYRNNIDFILKVSLRISVLHACFKELLVVLYTA